MFEKLYKTLEEIETKGSIFEQAKRLCEREKKIKMKLSKCKNDRLAQVILKADELEEELCEIRIEMIKLADRVKSDIAIFEENLDIEALIEIFKLSYEEYDDFEDFYSNLIASTTPLGHVIRVNLIYKEKLIKDRYR